jgi:hypothetical protein
MVNLVLLTAKPESGTVLERHYGVSTDTYTWVRFESSTGEFEPWVGIFPNAPVAFFSTAVSIGRGPTALVVACGQGYVVDVFTGAVIRMTPWDYAYSAASVPDRDFVVVANTTEIWGTYEDREQYARLSTPWFTPLDHRAIPTEAESEEYERVALDGIVFETVTAHELRGKVWWPNGWHNFTLDFDTWVVRQEGPVAGAADSFQAIEGRGGYPTSSRYYEWMSQHWLR